MPPGSEASTFKAQARSSSFPGAQIRWIEITLKLNPDESNPMGG